MPSSTKDSNDRRFMRSALSLARKGLGRSSPNPAVGSVVVKRGRIVGRGFHAKQGEPHAEVNALLDAGEAAGDATIYVTLEPCHHQGRTPPCTRAIMEAGVKRVVYGASDPNPKVAGGGGGFLATQGLKVKAGVLREACEHEHRFFFKHITTGRPYVVLKTAATLDGKTAARSGDSRWVTGEKARRQVHRMRSWLDAICVGSGTALADNPSLTCRLRGGRDPLRVVVDTKLKMPPTAKVLDGSSSAGCLVACGKGASAKRRTALEKAGAEVLEIPKGLKGGVDLTALMEELGKRGVISLLLEGGAGLAWGFLQQGLIDEVAYFYAPKLIGGQNTSGMIGGAGFARMAQAVMLYRPRIRRFGDDFLLQAKVKQPA
jgi:diaminohydroxyphosphoribosylaminopyrimidine deaminase/5-amino-6-(5-phosphoribosylamino)uracil reductase